MGCCNVNESSNDLVLSLDEKLKTENKSDFKKGDITPKEESSKTLNDYPQQSTIDNSIGKSTRINSGNLNNLNLDPSKILEDGNMNNNNLKIHNGNINNRSNGAPLVVIDVVKNEKYYGKRRIQESAKIKDLVKKLEAHVLGYDQKTYSFTTEIIDDNISEILSDRPHLKNKKRKKIEKF